MLRFNRLPVNSDRSAEARSFQYGNPQEFIIQQNFSDENTETIIIDDTNYQYFNQDDNNIQNWMKGCQILGFIPDHPTDSYTQNCFHDSLSYQSQQKQTRSPYQNHSNNLEQSTLRVNLKRRRRRTIFTTEQIVFLEGVFQMKPYISRDERIAMMNRLQISEKAIKIWFQNRRRMTEKRSEECYISDSPTSSDDSTDSFSDKLKFIERQIQENTDTNGFVTLNEQVMSELASLIDDYLSRDVTHSNSDSLSYTTVNDDIVMYEPISPVCSDYNVI